MNMAIILLMRIIIFLVFSMAEFTINDKLTTGTLKDADLIAYGIESSGNYTLQSRANSELAAYIAAKNQTVSGNKTFTGAVDLSAATLTPKSGTHTPFLFGGTTGGSPTYVSRVGKHIEFGNLVFVQGEIRISSLGGLTGEIFVFGMPFTCNTSPAAPNISISNHVNYNLASGLEMGAHMSGGNPAFRMKKISNTTSANLLDTDVTANFWFNYTGFYLKA